MELKFRLLEANEIECRDAMASDKGVSVLLYKDARVDQNILDEAVGPMNWQRHHLRDNANCIVSIWDSDKKQWVEKEDTGKESNAEKEKGLASDSFKRACFNWGIGRELYTAPFVWINGDKIGLKKNSKGRYVHDSIEVVGITYGESRNITSLTIRNVKTNAIVYQFGKAVPTKVETKADAVPARTQLYMQAKDVIDFEKFYKLYNVKGLHEMSDKQITNALEHWEQVVKMCGIKK